MEKKYVELALLNIVNFGDTDIFPYPIENQIFFDSKDAVIKLINTIDSDLDNFLSKIPPINVRTYFPHGYTGFRWATQIDPIWNAYFLALVLSISDRIESVRVPTSRKVVYSYRYAPDYKEGYLFDMNIDWMAFQKESIEIAENSDIENVVICDIADFYTRINHHSLENALSRICVKNDVPNKIMKLLQKFSDAKSYGLPIGGPAARILAELILNKIDRILMNQGIRFCRFVDDFHIFTKSTEDSYSCLNFLVEKIMINEGFSLQNYKTQIPSRAGFINMVEKRIFAKSKDVNEKEIAKFMSLRIRYDPYSETADKDYEEIRNELSSFNILELLNEELRKSRIQKELSKHLLKSFKFLDDNIVSKAFIAISNKIELIYPIFPSVMIAAFSNYEKFNDNARKALTEKLIELVVTDSYIIQVDLNAAYLARVLGKENSLENEEILNKLFNKFNASILVRRVIIQIMARWKSHHWISDLKNSFHTMNQWERRIFIISSYILGDEGKHWREHNKKSFTDFEILIRDWAVGKSKKPKWEIPL